MFRLGMPEADDTTPQLHVLWRVGAVGKLAGSHAQNAMTITRAECYSLVSEPGVYRERISTHGKAQLSIVGLGPAEEVGLALKMSCHRLLCTVLPRPTMPDCMAAISLLRPTVPDCMATIST